MPKNKEDKFKSDLKTISNAVQILQFHLKSSQLLTETNTLIYLRYKFESLTWLLSRPRQSVYIVSFIFLSDASIPFPALLLFSSKAWYDTVYMKYFAEKCIVSLNRNPERFNRLSLLAPISYTSLSFCQGSSLLQNTQQWMCCECRNEKPRTYQLLSFCPFPSQHSSMLQ